MAIIMEEIPLRDTHENIILNVVFSLRSVKKMGTFARHSALSVYSNIIVSSVSPFRDIV